MKLSISYVWCFSVFLAAGYDDLNLWNDYSYINLDGANMRSVTTPTMAESDDDRDEGEMKEGGIDGRGAAGYGDVQGVPRLRKKCDMQWIYGDDDSDSLP
ncbi:hypothetical protein KSS87_022836 [Heliosperma pusillum]|nr:hypothetical protein KSS87_022836 [Heliosperma pusillum]